MAVLANSPSRSAGSWRNTFPESPIRKSRVCLTDAFEHPIVSEKRKLEERKEKKQSKVTSSVTEESQKVKDGNGSGPVPSTGRVSLWGVGVVIEFRRGSFRTRIRTWT